MREFLGKQIYLHANRLIAGKSEGILVKYLGIPEGFLIEIIGFSDWLGSVFSFDHNFSCLDQFVEPLESYVLE